MAPKRKAAQRASEQVKRFAQEILAEDPEILGQERERKRGRGRNQDQDQVDQIPTSSPVESHTSPSAGTMLPPPRPTLTEQVANQRRSRRKRPSIRPVLNNGSGMRTGSSSSPPEDDDMVDLPPSKHKRRNSTSGGWPSHATPNQQIFPSLHRTVYSGSPSQRAQSVASSSFQAATAVPNPAQHAGESRPQLQPHFNPANNGGPENEYLDIAHLQYLRADTRSPFYADLTNLFTNELSPSAGNDPQAKAWRTARTPVRRQSDAGPPEVQQNPGTVEEEDIPGPARRPERRDGLALIKEKCKELGENGEDRACNESYRLKHAFINLMTPQKALKTSVLNYKQDNLAENVPRLPPTPAFEHLALSKLKHARERAEPTIFGTWNAPRKMSDEHKDGCSFCNYECDYGVADERTWLPVEAATGYCRECHENTREFHEEWSNTLAGKWVRSHEEPPLHIGEIEVEQARWSELEGMRQDPPLKERGDELEIKRIAVEYNMRRYVSWDDEALMKQRIAAVELGVTPELAFMAESPAQQRCSGSVGIGGIPKSLRAPISLGTACQPGPGLTINGLGRQNQQLSGPSSRAPGASPSVGPQQSPDCQLAVPVAGVPNQITSPTTRIEHLNTQDTSVDAQALTLQIRQCGPSVSRLSSGTSDGENVLNKGTDPTLQQSSTAHSSCVRHINPHSFSGSGRARSPMQGLATITSSPPSSSRGSYLHRSSRFPGAVSSPPVNPPHTNFRRLSSPSPNPDPDLTPQSPTSRPSESTEESSYFHTQPMAPPPRPSQQLQRLLSNFDGKDITRFQNVNFCRGSPYRQLDVYKTKICAGCKDEKFAVVKHQRHRAFYLLALGDASAVAPVKFGFDDEPSVAGGWNVKRAKACMICPAQAMYGCRGCPLRLCGDCHTNLTRMCKGILNNVFYYFERMHLRNDAFLLRSDGGGF